MKTVFTNSMVAHVWAQGRQSRGRSNNKQFHFYGKLLYSYGAHYVVGYLLKPGIGLVNSKRCSRTTSQHTSNALQALTKAYAVEDLTAFVRILETGDRKRIERHFIDHDQMVGIETLQMLGYTRIQAVAAHDRIEKAIDKNAITLKRSQLKATARNNLTSEEQFVNRLSDSTLGNIDRLVSILNHTLKAVKALNQSESSIEKAKNRLSRARAYRKELKIAQKAEQEISAKEALERWQRGGLIRPPKTDRIALRRITSRDGIETLETSHGARVPMVEAIGVFKLAAKCRELGKPFEKTNGDDVRVGHFKIDRINSKGDIRAGCHFISWDESERLAVEIGIFETA